jgi:hypothetical protein
VTAIGGDYKDRHIIGGCMVIIMLSNQPFRGFVVVIYQN